MTGVIPSKAAPEATVQTKLKRTEKSHQ